MSQESTGCCLRVLSSHRLKPSSKLNWGVCTSTQMSDQLLNGSRLYFYLDMLLALTDYHLILQAASVCFCEMRFISSVQTFQLVLVIQRRSVPRLRECVFLGKLSLCVRVCEERCCLINFIPRYFLGILVFWWSLQCDYCCKWVAAWQKQSCWPRKGKLVSHSQRGFKSCGGSAFFPTEGPVRLLIKNLPVWAFIDQMDKWLFSSRPCCVSSTYCSSVYDGWWLLKPLTHLTREACDWTLRIGIITREVMKLDVCFASTSDESPLKSHLDVNATPRPEVKNTTIH